jgi:transposase-like protein
MNLIEIFQNFQTQEQAVDYLEGVRWRGRTTCPYCKSESVCRHASGDRAGMRWQCQSCTRAFSVTVGTIFHGTHIGLRNWFLVLGLMLNAKKSASACQIARDLGMRRPTVWSMMHRIREAMAKDTMQAELLYGIVEADETYVGGKPRKGNRRDGTGGTPSKRGRGTSKTPVVGIMERGGRVVAKMFEKRDLTNKGLRKFIERFVDVAASVLMTDEFSGYSRMHSVMDHLTINHKVAYAEGIVHTNSIEGFWSLVKRAYYGQHHHYSVKYMDLYISEACYKYNTRKVPVSLESALGLLVA